MRDDRGLVSSSGGRRGGFEDFEALFARDLLARWLEFRAVCVADPSAPRLFQFLTYERFVRLAYELS